MVYRGLTLTIGVAVESVSLLKDLLDRVQGLDARLSDVAAELAGMRQQQTVRDWYSTKEIADLLGKTMYTVREWCRFGRMAATKLPHGRGNEGEWRVSHDELTRYRAEGLLPLSPQARLR